MRYTNKTCGQCALMQHSGGICPVFKTEQPHDHPGCPYHAFELDPCPLCGNHMPKEHQLIDMTDSEHFYIYCDNCSKYVGHCETCTNAQNCSFETDPSSIPKMVQKEIRQGNMIQIMTVKNPSRIDITCKKGCPCFSEEFGCLRQINYCDNYKFILKEQS